MSLNMFIRDEVMVVELSGRLDSATAPVLQDKILQMITPKMRLVFDLKDCPYISSPGINLLLQTGKKLSLLEGKAVLANLSHNVKEVMEMTGFLNIYKSFPSTEAAIKAVRA